MILTDLEVRVLKAGNPPNVDTTIAQRQFTRREYNHAVGLRAQGYNAAQIGRIIDRSPHSVARLFKKFSDAIT